jgi:hypothetical protein
LAEVNSGRIPNARNDGGPHDRCFARMLWAGHPILFAGLISTVQPDRGAASQAPMSGNPAKRQHPGYDRTRRGLQSRERIPLGSTLAKGQAPSRSSSRRLKLGGDKARRFHRGEARMVARRWRPIDHPRPEARCQSPTASSKHPAGLWLVRLSGDGHHLPNCRVLASDRKGGPSDAPLRDAGSQATAVLAHGRPPGSVPVRH